MAKSASVGTKLTVDSTEIGGLTSIGGIEITADQHDVTAVDNTSGYREFVAGFKDGGEVSLSGFMDGEDEGQTKLYTLMGTGASADCVITFPTTIGYKWTFTGIVTAFSTSEDVDNPITFSATIRVSGAPVLAKVSA